MSFAIYCILRSLQPGLLAPMAAEMWQPKPLHFLLLLATTSLYTLACTVAGDGGGMPLVTAITKGRGHLALHHVAQEHPPARPRPLQPHYLDHVRRPLP
jgi:hypothetical protein